MSLVITVTTIVNFNSKAEYQAWLVANVGDKAVYILDKYSNNYTKRHYVEYMD